VVLKRTGPCSAKEGDAQWAAKREGVIKIIYTRPATRVRPGSNKTLAPAPPYPKERKKAKINHLVKQKFLTLKAASGAGYKGGDIGFCR